MPEHVMVIVSGPPSNSATAAFNRYSIRFLQPVFGEEFSFLGARRRIIGTLSAGHLSNGHHNVILDFTTRDGGFRWGDGPWWFQGGNPPPAGGAFGLPQEQWRGVGQPSFTLTTGEFTEPVVGDSTILHVRSTDWMAPGTPLYIHGNTYRVIGALGPNRVNVRRIT